jgi:hypothetical protein
MVVLLPLPFQNVCSGSDFGADVVGFDFYVGFHCSVDGCVLFEVC